MSGIVGIMTLASENIKVLSYFRDQLIGANLAQEGAELVRNKRDSNFIKCVQGIFPPCLSPTVDYTLYNMDGMTGSGPCDDLLLDGVTPRGCKISDPFASDLSFEVCADGDCGKLKQDNNGRYGYTGATLTKYNRKIKITQSTNRGGSPTLYDWRVEVIVSWRDRLVDRSVVVNDVLTPSNRF